jgi:hypothetical protein
MASALIVQALQKGPCNANQTSYTDMSVTAKCKTSTTTNRCQRLGVTMSFSGLQILRSKVWFVRVPCIRGAKEGGAVYPLPRLGQCTACLNIWAVVNKLRHVQNFFWYTSSTQDSTSQDSASALQRRDDIAFEINQVINSQRCIPIILGVMIATFKENDRYSHNSYRKDAPKIHTRQPSCTYRL